MKAINTAMGGQHTPTQKELEDAWWRLQRLGQLASGEKVYHGEAFIEEDLTALIKAHRAIRKSVKDLAARFPHYHTEPA